MKNVYSRENRENWAGAAPFDHASGIWGRGRFIEYLSDRIEKGARVVDLGCGAGLATTYLSSMVGSKGSVIGIDNSEPLIGDAKAYEDNFSNICFESGSLDVPLLLETNSVDWFVSFMTLQNLTGNQRRAMFAECKRCLKPKKKMAHLTLHPNFFEEEWSLDFIKYDQKGLNTWRNSRSSSLHVNGRLEARNGSQKPVYAYPFEKLGIFQELEHSGLRVDHEVEIHVDTDRIHRLFPHASCKKIPKGPLFWILQTSQL